MASRTGSARVFFEIVGQFQAERLLKDADSAAVVTKAIWLDAAGGIIEAFEFAFDGIRDLVEENIESFKAYEEQLIQVRKFYQGSEEDIMKFADASMYLGETFAFSGAEALKAAAQMAQMKTVLGSPEAVIAGTEMGLLFAEIGNMDTQLAMKRMTSLMQQTGFAMGGLTQAQYDNLDAQTQAQVVMSNTMRVLDQLNTIENSSVATMEDMTFVLNQFSAQGNLAGESMASMAAFAAILLEAGEETSRAGTGLRMIYSRLAVDGGDASEAIAEVVPHLDATTVSTMSLSGVLDELIPYYVNLTDIEKVRLTQAIAGNRHYVKLQKVIENHERYITLTGMAYSGTYGAVEEFENRQESMKFKIDKANAMIENQRALVGENLAEAYVKSLEPQYQFLKLLEKSTEESDKYSASLGGLEVSVKDTLENIMLLGAVVEQLTLPLNFVMGLGNILISAQAFGAINRQTREMQSFHTEAYGRRLYMMEQEKQMKLATLFDIEQASKTSHAAMMDRTAQQIGIKKTQAHNDFAYARQLKALNKGLIEDQKQLDMTKSKDVVKSVELQQQIKANEQIILQKTESSRLRKAEYDIDKAVYQQRASYEKGMQAYYKLSVGQRANQVKQQRALSGAIQNTYNNMANEVVVFRALTEEEIKAITTRVQANQVKATSIQLQLSEVRIRLQTAKLTEDERIALQNLILQHEEHLRNLGEEIAKDQILISADKQRINNIKQEAVSTRVLTQVYDNLHGSREANNRTLRQSVSLGTGLLGLYSMTAKSSKDMEAAMYGIIIAQGLYQAAMWISKKRTDGYTASVIMAQMATNIFYGALVAVVAYIGGKAIANALNLSSAFDDLSSSTEAMTANFGDLESVLKDLSMKGDESVLSGIVEASYNDLRASEQLAKESEEVLQNQVNVYSDIMDNFAGDKGSAEYQSAFRQHGIASQTLKEVQAIVEAHKGANQIYTDYVEGAMSDFESTNYALTQAYTDFVLGEDLWDERNTDTALANPTWAKQGLPAYYRDLENGTRKYYHTYSELQADLRKENMLYVQDVEETGLALAASYDILYGSVLDAVISGEGEVRDMVSGSLDQMNEFANAREELFFGSQANFQGAIYKQITQGGVESVLHRVEIMQHNHFNGMTLPEMVSQVTEGVIVEMRGQGVPI
tara:strand:+ start:5543 stop:9010 length:3468 start_codon:yes stop_codon:yes gene_type:complete